MKKKTCNKAFTIVELLMASVITVIIGAAIAVLFVASMRMFSRGMAQTNIQRRARTALDKISRDIRNSGKGGGTAGLTVYNSYSDQTPNIAQGDYIEITDTLGNTAGYYLSSSGGINFIKDVASDIAVEADDKEIISGVSKVGGSSIFTGPFTNSALIQFKVTSSSANIGSQSANFITNVFMRNP